MQVSDLDITHLGLAGLGFVVWLVRLEGKVLAVQREASMAGVAVRSLQQSHSVLELKVVEELGKIREALARIEGQIRGGDPS